MKTQCKRAQMHSMKFCGTMVLVFALFSACQKSNNYNDTSLSADKSIQKQTDANVDNSLAVRSVLATKEVGSGASLSMSLEDSSLVNIQVNDVIQITEFSYEYKLHLEKSLDLSKRLEEQLKIDSKDRLFKFKLLDIREYHQTKNHSISILLEREVLASSQTSSLSEEIKKKQLTLVRLSLDPEHKYELESLKDIGVMDYMGLELSSTPKKSLYSLLMLLDKQKNEKLLILDWNKEQILSLPLKKPEIPCTQDANLKSKDLIIQKTSHRLIGDQIRVGMFVSLVGCNAKNSAQNIVEGEYSQFESALLSFQIDMAKIKQDEKAQSSQSPIKDMKSVLMEEKNLDFLVVGNQSIYALTVPAQLSNQLSVLKWNLDTEMKTSKLNLGESNNLNYKLMIQDAKLIKDQLIVSLGAQEESVKVSQLKSFVLDLYASDLKPIQTWTIQYEDKSNAQSQLAIAQNILYETDKEIVIMGMVQEQSKNVRALFVAPFKY